MEPTRHSFDGSGQCLPADQTMAFSSSDAQSNVESVEKRVMGAMRACSAPNLALESDQSPLSERTENKIKSKFEQNAALISNFPKGEQIKGSHGVLEYCGKGKNWLFGFIKTKLGYLTTLPKTVSVMHKTFHIAQKNFIESYHFFSQSPENIMDTVAFGMHLERERKLRADYETELKMVKGLGRIKTSYFRHYHHTHQGLPALAKLYAEGVERLRQHEALMNSLRLDHNRLKRVNNVEESANCLRAFCKRYSNVKYQDACRYIAQGKALVEEIRDNKISRCTEEDRQEKMADLAWFLMYYAIKRQQGHFEGSFVVEWEPLKSFMLCSPKKNRKSTHLNGHLNEQWYETKVESHRTPAQKGTILFGLFHVFQCQDSVLFFKPEGFSCTESLWEYALHGLDLIVTRGKKFFWPGTDDSPGMQKERVPRNSLAAFEKIVDYLEENPSMLEVIKDESFLEHFNKAIDKAGLWGIAYMNRFATFIKENHPSDELADLVIDLEKTWASLDNLQNRTGREVYIRGDQLLQFLNEPLVFEE